VTRTFWTTIAGTLAVGLVAAGTAGAQTISEDQTVRGRLDATDPRLPGERRYDCWVHDLEAGAYTVELRSTDFDAVVSVGEGRNCRSDAVSSNDDGEDGGTDSLLVFRTDGGPGFIRATTFEPGEAGAYSLSLEAGGGFYIDDGSYVEDSFPKVEALLTRPGEEAHLANVVCTAANTRDLLAAFPRMTPAQREARWVPLRQLEAAAKASGEALGYDWEDISVQIYEARRVFETDHPLMAELPAVPRSCFGAMGPPVGAVVGP
jgi:hypothetical protein